jgi:galactokinase
VTGNIPQGAGLSSSAALEVGVVRALAEVSGLDLDVAEIAAIGQSAENDFVGCSCGMMDQLICVCGRQGSAIAIDCRSLELTALAIPLSLSVLIINSNVARGLVASEYNLRRQQCETAARYFDKACLRDLGLPEFRQRRGELAPIVARRAQHVLEENQRVLDMMAAFGREDIPRISELMAASHRSMKDLFDITIPEIDLLVDVVQRIVGDSGGARMTGGGFGGCVVALLPEAMVAEVLAAVAQEYESHFGLVATSYRTQPTAGVTLLY